MMQMAVIGGATDGSAHEHGELLERITVAIEPFTWLSARRKSCFLARPC